MAYTTTYNKLDLYRKILDLRNINEVVSMLEHQDYLDFDYDKWLYSSDIKKHYLSEKSVAKNVSRELELMFIKERYAIMYDVFYSFFDNRANIVLSEYTLAHGDIVYVSGLVDENDINYYKIDIDGATITLKTKDDADVELSDLTGTFTISKGDFIWIGDSITYNNPDTTLTLVDDNLVSQAYITECETDDDKETRIASTTEYRKLFLKFVPLLEIFKGTKMYIEFVLKFYYLIKYYDISLSASQNITIAETASTVYVEYPQQINFVYYITSLIPKAEWELYIKPCVHPHGWIDTYYETLYNSDVYIQKEFNSKENKPTYCDVLLSSKPEILKNVSTVKRYGNVETEDTAVSIGIDSSNCNISGGFKTYEFDYYDINNAKIELAVDNYTIPPPQFSYEGNDGTNTTLKCLFTIDSVPDITYEIFNLCCYNSSEVDNPLLEDNPTTTGTITDIYDIDDGNVYHGVTTIVGDPLVIANPNNYTHLWIQTVIYNGSDVVTKSDIISFEIIGSGRIPTPIVPSPPITEPESPSPK